MIVQINRSQEQWQKLMDCVQGNFDNPSVKYIEGDNIFFSGWFLPLEKDIFIQADYPNGDSQTFYLNQPRPDVVKVFSLSENEINCGFWFSLNVKDLEEKESINVSVCTNVGCFNLYTIGSMLNPNKDEERQVIDFWEELFVGGRVYSDFNDDYIDRICELTKKFLAFNKDREFVFCQIKKYKNINPFLSFDEFNKFVNHFENEKWSLWATQESYKVGGLIHQIQDTTINYKCIKSYSISDYNYLCFKIKGLNFIVVQHCRNVAVLFPTLALSIGFYIQQWFSVAIARLKLLIKKIKRNDLIGESRFLGVNATQTRPYHFVYDYLHGLEYLSHQGVSCPVINTKGYDFLDIGKIFDNVASFQVLNEQEINSRQGFYIAPCWQYIHSDYDRNLIGLSTLLKNKANQLINKPLEIQADLYFWVSVSVEKRRWVEQESGIIEIIKKLSERYPSLCVMIDGRTRVMSEAIGVNATAQAETKIFEAIKEPFETNQNVSFFSLIGATMLEKIYLSQKVNVFLTHYLTDSMYVSAIQKKTGVVYAVPENESERCVHIHTDVVGVPRDKVRVLNPEEIHQWQSVSMNWQDVYECIEQVLNKIGK